MTSPPRTLRADAVRNRAILLEAAEKEFAERGPGASVADIARRAGVGKGTVFRHFASKDELIAAIVHMHISVLDATGRRLLTTADPGAALYEFLTAAAAQREQQDVSFLLTADDASAEVVALREQLYATIGALVDRAREAGAIRPDVTTTDVVLLMCAPNHVVSFVKDPPPDLWRRYLALIFDGLRPEGAHPLGPPPAPL
ncbi:TetR/AcrR family transcriptional regulator [Actinoplanes sp. M2I2]|uniref:TetR family transcriptional regulator n=1 Tax=Actinoplanes sp. M2I2 TaxID=1734444 RepID=UPI002020CF19|nr:TetR/AcrR family transcriptional regulator [Actinoplanes sp. M2I2]